MLQYGPIAIGVFGGQFGAMALTPILCKKFEKKTIFNVMNIVSGVAFAMIFVLYLIFPTTLGTTASTIATIMNANCKFLATCSELPPGNAFAKACAIGTMIKCNEHCIRCGICNDFRFVFDIPNNFGWRSNHFAFNSILNCKCRYRIYHGIAINDDCGLRRLRKILVCSLSVNSYFSIGIIDKIIPIAGGIETRKNIIIANDL